MDPIFPDVPVSSKPAEVRMGKGKGSQNTDVPVKRAESCSSLMVWRLISLARL